MVVGVGFAADSFKMLLVGWCFHASGFSRPVILMRRSQTATEYLIILAVVIIIALIVVGVLGGIPGIGGGVA